MQLKEYERKYLPAEFSPGRVADIEERFDELDQRVVATLAELQSWCQDWSELQSVLDEEGNVRFVKHTCHTDDEEIKKRYLEYLEEISPVIKKRSFELCKKLANHPLAAELPADEYTTYLRSVRNHVELFREENVPLETEETKLESEYDQTIGAMTVEFQGEERTLPQMHRFQEETDREVREAAFRGVFDRVMQDVDRIEDIFDKQLELRSQMAKNAGFPDYRDLRFRMLERFDYTPEDCLEFHSAVEQVIIPIQKRRSEARRQHLGVDKLRPWDLAVDPQSRAPLRPFEGGEQLARGCHEMFQRLDPALGAHFGHMLDRNLLDLETRKGKAPGGYQATYQEQRMPFIFMNAAGMHDDVVVLLHEGGHAFHTMESRDQALRANRDSPIEFAEVASMAMELLAADHFDVFYDDPNHVRRARIEHLEGIISVFPWIATIDAFQHWIYTHPGHTRDERTTAWLELMDRFGSAIDWSGMEHYRSKRWVRQSHLFGVPFYYIEYGIAQLGALQVWLRSRQDHPQALSSYREALALGNRRPLPQLFEAAGAQFDFSAETMSELLGAVEKEIVGLEAEDAS